MSKKNKLIINCGITHVSAATFSVVGGKLILDSFDSRELDYDYGVAEQWLPALSIALKSMRLSGKANVIVPSSYLITKTITVPHVDATKRNEIISFEAAKNIPYTLSDVSWDHQVISDDGVETEILLAAMKATAADDFCTAIKTAGIFAESVEASSVLDYNAWKYCGLPSDVMILNVGAKSSNLIIARNDGLFVRNIPIGGSSITQVVSDSLGKSFMQSEQLKRNYFSSHKNLEAGGDHIAELIRTTTLNTAKRLSMELKRTILNYKRKGTVLTPTKLYLTGRGSLIPGLSDILCEDMQVSVEYFDILSNIKVSSKVNSTLVSQSSPQLSELVGEAARMVLPETMGVNLLPKHIIEAYNFSRRKPFLLLGAALLAVSVFPSILWLTNSNAVYSKAIKDFSSMIPAINARIDEVQNNKVKIEGLLSKINDFETLAQSKSNWIKLFADFENRLFEMKDVWLNDLKVSRQKVKKQGGESEEYKLIVDGELLLRDVDTADGTTYDAKKAIERIQGLLSSFKKSEFISDNKVDVRTDRSNPRILKFNFTLFVNPKKPI